MKTLQVNVYQYSELNEKAKEKARNWYLEWQDFSFEWDSIKDDAKNVGLKLTAWDYGRYCEGEFIGSAKECAEAIIKEHGKTCETYKTATAFLGDIKKEQDEEKIEDREKNFLLSILEDYRILADKNYDYMQSEEAIAESMEANEYTFLENGKRFQQ